MEIKCRSKRTLKEKTLVLNNDIADIIELRFPGIDIQESDKVICCLKVGWKFGLYFNFVRNPNLVQKEISSSEFEEVELEVSNIVQMQTQLGQLYRYLAFQYVYQSLESEPIFEKMVTDGWFPFVEILGNEYKTLSECYQNEKFTYNDKVRILLESFNETRLKRITDKWWENPFFQEKIELLQVGLDAFLGGTKSDYISCVKNLYPEIKGIMRSLYRADHEKGAYRTQKLLEHLLAVGKHNVEDDHSLLLPNEFLKYLASSFFKGFNPAIATDDLSRHSVAHGVASEKGYSAEKALQAFSSYNFSDGNAFQPDFVLFLREKNGSALSYQLFIEPKGKHIADGDRWKEEFLQEICAEYQSKVLTENSKYRIIGVPSFYNEDHENQFREDLDNALKTVS